MTPLFGPIRWPLIGFSDFLLLESYPTQLKKICQTHQRTPYVNCDEISAATYKAHGDRFHYYAVVDDAYDKTKELHRHFKHMFMRDPIKKVYFDGQGKVTRKQLLKDFSGDFQRTKSKIVRVDPKKEKWIFDHHYNESYKKHRNFPAFLQAIKELKSS